MDNIQVFRHSQGWVGVVIGAKVFWLPGDPYNKLHFHESKMSYDHIQSLAKGDYKLSTEEDLSMLIENLDEFVRLLEYV